MSDDICLAGHSRKHVLVLAQQFVQLLDLAGGQMDSKDYVWGGLWGVSENKGGVRGLARSCQCFSRFK